MSNLNMLLIQAGIMANSIEQLTMQLSAFQNGLAKLVEDGSLSKPVARGSHTQINGQPVAIRKPRQRRTPANNTQYSEKEDKRIMQVFKKGVVTVEGVKLLAKEFGRTEAGVQAHAYLVLSRKKEEEPA